MVVLPVVAPLVDPVVAPVVVPVEVLTLLSSNESESISLVSIDWLSGTDSWLPPPHDESDTAIPKQAVTAKVVHCFFIVNSCSCKIYVDVVYLIKKTSSWQKVHKPEAGARLFN